MDHRDEDTRVATLPDIGLDMRNVEFEYRIRKEFDRLEEDLNNQIDSRVDKRVKKEVKKIKEELVKSSSTSVWGLSEKDLRKVKLWTPITFCLNLSAYLLTEGFSSLPIHLGMIIASSTLLPYMVIVITGRDKERNREHKKELKKAKKKGEKKAMKKFMSAYKTSNN